MCTGGIIAYVEQSKLIWKLRNANSNHRLRYLHWLQIQFVNVLAKCCLGLSTECTTLGIYGHINPHDHIVLLQNDILLIFQGEIVRQQ
jgi:hypothetical protein